MGFSFMEKGSTDIQVIEVISQMVFIWEIAKKTLFQKWVNQTLRAGARQINLELFEHFTDIS